MHRHRLISPLRRRAAPAAAFALIVTLVSACGTSNAESGTRLLADAPIPTTAPPDTVLIVGDPQTKTALELSGRIDELPFEIKWANIAGGPETTRAIRAGALDLGAVAPISPLHATWTGLDVRIVAANVHRTRCGTGI